LGKAKIPPVKIRESVMGRVLAVKFGDRSGVDLNKTSHPYTGIAHTQGFSLDLVLRTQEADEARSYAGARVALFN
jgi:hypothetical protein